MYPRADRLALLPLLGLLVLLLAAPAGRAQTPEAPSLDDEALAAALMRTCRSEAVAAPFDGATRGPEREFRTDRENVLQRNWHFGREERIEVTRTRRIERPGYLYFAAYYGAPGGTRPFLRLVADQRCKVLGGERITYSGGATGEPVEFQALGPDLRPRAEAVPFNPEVPPATEPAGCHPVGLLDNGVNYLLPEIAPRLARDEAGELLGHDFWEDDERPFDFGIPLGARAVIGSPFDPPRHGTSVASILLADAPESVCAAIYRYHPGDPDARIGGIVDAIAEDGIRVLVLTTGRAEPWPEFEDAIMAHPEMLFVAAAGNNGVDLRRKPLYPMAYRQPNLLVVAAADGEGRIWDRNNRGEGLIGLAVPAVELPGLAFDGRPQRLTGTSFAAPRIGALAGALAAANPDWDGARLQEEVLAIAEAGGVAEEGIPVLSEAALKAALQSNR